ncbi:MAG: hypothetical protein GX088_02640 [Clostridia bacterium]|nr:hypothetical protein [Clostridia bacterium]
MLFKRFSVLLFVFLLFGFFIGAVESIEAATSPIKVFEQPVTAGAVHKEYRWDTAKGQVRIHVLEVDLKNPYVVLGTIPGAGKITKRLNVSAMAQNTGAVAAVNGDFFNINGEGAPIGPMVVDGRTASSPSKIDGLYALGINKDGKAVIQSFSFWGRVVSPSGDEFPLSGLNKTAYWEQDGSHSHYDKLHLYDDMWGGAARGNDGYTTPTEVLVKNGRVVEISEGSYLPYEGVSKGAYILRGHGKAADFLLQNFKIGDRVKIEYFLEPRDSWSMIIGGHALLVDEGKAIPYAKSSSSLEGLRARTAVGVSRDGDRVYLVGVEKSNQSIGLDLGDLSSFMVYTGSWRALNLDGGGSTTMVVRPLGEFSTVRAFDPEQGTERYVPNAIGIFTKAPASALKGIILEVKNKNNLLVGEKIEYKIKGYDGYYNPVNVGDAEILGDEEVIKVEKGVAIASNPGQGRIKAVKGGIEGEAAVQVVGKDDIERMVLKGPEGIIVPNQNYDLKLTITALGSHREVPFDLVQWEFYGFKGEVSSEGLKVKEYHQPWGYLVARYQQFSAPLLLKFSQESPGDEGKTQVKLAIGDKNAKVNGTTIQMDVAPQIINGRTMVPMRFVSQACGADVFWDQEARRATVVGLENFIDLWPEYPKMAVGGQSVTLDQPGVIVSGRILLPLRAVGEALNLTIHWDEGTKSITLNKE